MLRKFHYCTYKDVENWIVEDQRFVRAEDGISDVDINYVCVNIGDIYFYVFSEEGRGAEVSVSPILRWISEGEFNRLKKKSGTIIF